MVFIATGDYEVSKFKNVKMQQQDLNHVVKTTVYKKMLISNTL
jgi:hypothetical protein